MQRSTEQGYDSVRRKFDPRPILNHSPDEVQPGGLHMFGSNHAANAPTGNAIVPVHRHCRTCRELEDDPGIWLLHPDNRQTAAGMVRVVMDTPDHQVGGVDHAIDVLRRLRPTATNRLLLKKMALWANTARSN